MIGRINLLIAAFGFCTITTNAQYLPQYGRDAHYTPDSHYSANQHYQPPYYATNQHHSDASHHAVAPVNALGHDPHAVNYDSGFAVNDSHNGIIPGAQQYLGHNGSLYPGIHSASGVDRRFLPRLLQKQLQKLGPLSSVLIRTVTPVAPHFDPPAAHHSVAQEYPYHRPEPYYPQGHGY